jgi:hypothetical protein
VAELRDDVRERLIGALEANDLPVESVGEDRWMTMLSGEWKRTIPVLLDLGERHLEVTSLLTGVPDEGHEDVYRILLQRNQRPSPVHFALDDEGQVILTGAVPLVALDDRGVDELLGALLTTSDETFNQVLRSGFSSYIDAEQRWRESVGLPPNPVSEAP